MNKTEITKAYCEANNIPCEEVNRDKAKTRFVKAKHIIDSLAEEMYHGLNLKLTLAGVASDEELDNLVALVDKVCGSAKAWRGMK